MQKEYFMELSSGFPIGPTGIDNVQVVYGMVLSLDISFGAAAPLLRQEMGYYWFQTCLLHALLRLDSALLVVLIPS